MTPEAFPDDQDQKNPDGEKPMHVEQTLGIVTKLKRRQRAGRWLYAKLNMTDEEIRKFFSTPEDGKVERKGDTVAVWAGAEPPEYGAFDEAVDTERIKSDIDAYVADTEGIKSNIDAYVAAAAEQREQIRQTEPKSSPAPTRDIEGTLRTAGMDIWRLLEQEAVKSNAAESGKIAAISNELHAMASRFELARLRQGMKRG